MVFYSFQWLISVMGSKSVLELEQHLAESAEELKAILIDLEVSPVKLLTRVKSEGSIRAKLTNTPLNSLHGEKGDLKSMDQLGIRIIVETDNELENVFRTLSKREKTKVKDYVNNPRKDGLILQTNPKEIYQSYHVFTAFSNKVPIEIQLRTVEMESNRLALKHKYGEGYWKTPAFRRRKAELGDKR